MNINEFKPDEVMQTEGVWVDFDKDSAFLIAYGGNRKFERKIANLSIAARRKNRGKELDPIVYTDLSYEAMVGTVLLGWRGIKNTVPDPVNPGKTVSVPYEYSEANAEALLKDYPTLRGFIQEQSNILTNFQKEGENMVASSDKEELKSEPALDA